MKEKVARGNDAQLAKRLGAPRADALEIRDRHVEVQLAGWLRPPPTLAQSLTLYELAGERHRVEWLDVGDRLAGADELHRDTELFTHGENDSSLGGPVELGHHEPGNWNCSREGARLCDCVLSYRSVEDKQRFMRCARNTLSDHAMNLLKLVHEIRAGVKPACSVDYHDVGAVGNSRVDGVERHRGGIASGFAADEPRAAALGPHAELVDRSRAKRIRGAYERRSPARRHERRKLSNECRFARTVYSDHQNERWLHRCEMQRCVVAVGSERSRDSLLESVEKLLLAFYRPALRLLLDVLDETHAGRDSKIGLDENLLQLLERALNDSGLREEADVGHRDVSYALPQRPTRGVVRAAKNSGHRFQRRSEE